MTKVIAFSLYGNIPMYNVGMIKNIELAREIYPDWEVWIYYDQTISFNIIDKIATADKLIEGDKDTHKMMWRFLPSNVERFISRDADSRISMREKLAVDEWIASDKTLHIMRDHPHHRYRILGGMWGMKCDPDFDMLEEIKAYNQVEDLEKKMVDMDFLRDVVYPRYKDDSCIHASYHKREAWSKDFPTPMEDRKFVGEIYDENNNRHEQYKLL